MADACVVLDLPLSDPEQEAVIRKDLLDAVNSKGLTCSYHYSGKTGAARVILRGRPVDLAGILAKY